MMFTSWKRTSSKSVNGFIYPLKNYTWKHKSWHEVKKYSRLWTCNCWTSKQQDTIHVCVIIYTCTKHCLWNSRCGTVAVEQFCVVAIPCRLMKYLTSEGATLRVHHKRQFKHELILYILVYYVSRTFYNKSIKQSAQRWVILKASRARI